MPEIAPAPLEYSAGALRTSRMVPARLRFSAGTVLTAKDTPATPPAAQPELDNWTRFDRPQSITEAEWVRWMARDQSFTDAIEEAFRAVNARIDEVAILARLSTVETLAQSANDNAAQAQAQVAQTSAAVEQTFTRVDPTYGDYYNERRQSPEVNQQ